MLWKKTRSYEELIEEYFSALYGSNWQSVVEYLENYPVIPHVIILMQLAVVKMMF